MNSLHNYTASIRKSDDETNKEIIMTLRKHLNKNIKQIIETIERDSNLLKKYLAEYNHLQKLHSFVNNCADDYMNKTVTNIPSVIASEIDELGSLTAKALVTLAEQKNNVAIQALAKNELAGHLFG